MYNNKKGITLMELLAYITLVGIVVTLLTGTMSYAVQSYDKVNGQGAVYTEANFIMSTLISQANAFNPDYIRSCGDSCVDLVLEKETTINQDLGIFDEKIVNKTVQIRIDSENNIYIGNMKLNSSDYAVKSFKVEADGTTSPNLSYVCFDNSSEYANTCERFVLTIKLQIYRRTSEENPRIFEYENKFSF